MSELATRTPQEILFSEVRSDKFKQQIAAALDGDVSPNYFVRVSVTALIDNPDLADERKVEKASVFQALIKCAQDGLLPDGREAALVIFGGKAQYLPMVGGYRKIAGEHGWAIRSAVVYEHDAFEVELGLDPRLVHVPARPGRDRGQPIAAYAVGAHKDGRREFEVMTADEIEKVKKASRASSRGPWVDWWERMWEKTVARRLFKKLPLGGIERVERVLAADEQGDSLAAMYGPSAREVFEDPPVPRGEPADKTAGSRSADAAPVGADGGEGQAAGVQTPSPAPAAPDPWDDDPEPGGGAHDESAGLFVIPKVKDKGKMITKAGLTVAEAARDAQWFEWALKPERQWMRDGDALAMALTAYARALPGARAAA